MKECIICHRKKPLSDYYTHPQMGDGHLNRCKECCKEYARKRDTHAYDQRRHRTNPKRFLQHKYSMIKHRCTHPDLHRRYYGLDYLSNEEWEEWCETSYKTFLSLYENWQAAGCPRRLAPSIDRIDTSKGYIKGNLQWLTQAANSSKAWEDRKN